jgi:prepilin-type processing-associated H-X9-DG protein
MTVWDHGRTPGCANSNVAAPRGPWQQPGGGYVKNDDTTHYPVRRHSGVMNVLFCDAHATPMTQNDLKDQLFYANGP